MAAFDPAQFPLVEMQAVANACNQWVALTVRIADEGGAGAALQALFNTHDLLSAVAPLDCVLMLAAPAVLSPPLLDRMPPDRIIFAFAAGALAVEGAERQMLDLQQAGYRILLDGPVPDGGAAPPGLRSVSLDCSAGALAPGSLPAVLGPHLARAIDSGARLAECEAAGFSWFSGDYPIHPGASAEPHDGTSRKRLLDLLGLLARDADSRELETLLKQDPALSYHLLKLVNSAAFALSMPINSFGQAISLLGRRQLQRWLQLLLYARRHEDGLPNLLLPLAALRAAQMESLCKLQGGDHEAQDLAFMAGVFSLLDVLLALPMDQIVGALGLAPDVRDALLRREGPLGTTLRLAETAAPSLQDLQDAAIAPGQWWKSQLQAYHWAIQVSRNL
jgi:EAL and modified HD-GYP domain-containing signal transduction protein